MTVTESRLTGALSDRRGDWDAISWGPVRHAVRRLQVRIAKAVRERRPARVKALMWLLTHSYHAKLLAVKRVVSNKGRRTPWRGPENLEHAAQECVFRTMVTSRFGAKLPSVSEHGYQ